MVFELDPEGYMDIYEAQKRVGWNEKEEKILAKETEKQKKGPVSLGTKRGQHRQSFTPMSKGQGQPWKTYHGIRL